MSSRFLACHKITAQWEGGKSDHKDDPGGRTNYGVTERVWHAYCVKKGWPKTSVFSITKAQSEAVYHEEYWSPSGAERMFAGVDLAHYDGAVNSGLGQANKWLRASVGSNDHSVTVKRLCAKRLGFMQSLKIWKTFGKGWARRVADIEVKGVAMALAAMGQVERIAPNATVENGKATKAASKAKTVERGFTGTSGLSGGVTVNDVATSGADGNLSLLVAFIVVTAICAFIFYRKRQAQEARAEAYAGVLV